VAFNLLAPKAESCDTSLGKAGGWGGGVHVSTEHSRAISDAVLFLYIVFFLCKRMTGAIHTWQESEELADQIYLSSPLQ